MTFAGIDPIYEPMPVRPGAHYHMGGIETDNFGATELTGLYAAGECACVSVHGANRLGGNSLMETITFGRRAGTRRRRVGADAHDDRGAGVRSSATPSPDLRALLDRGSGERPWKIREELGSSMLENFAVFRREDQMLAPARDPDRAARAVQERLRRGQGRGLQQRPDAGDRARQHARHRTLHGRGRHLAQGERAARTRGRTTIRRATTRTSWCTRSRAGGTTPSSCRRATCG